MKISKRTLVMLFLSISFLAKQSPVYAQGSGSGEFPIQAGPNSAVCRQDLASVWASRFQPMAARLKVWNEAKRDYSQQKQELLNRRILGGFGPPVQSVDARMVSDAASAIKVSANAIRRGIEVFLPFERGASSRAISFYENLEMGKTLVEAVDWSLGEWLWFTVSYFNPVANTVDALYQTANDFNEAVRTKTDWENVSREVQARVQQLDRLISNADQKINRELNRIRDQVQQDFVRFARETNKTAWSAPGRLLIRLLFQMVSGVEDREL